MRYDLYIYIVRRQRVNSRSVVQEINHVLHDLKIRDSFHRIQPMHVL